MAASGGSALIPLRDKAAIVAILALILGGFGYAAFWRAAPIDASVDPTDAAMIYAGLPADAGAANAAFRARVISGFPLRTPEGDLVQALSRQGFKSDGWFGKRMTFRRLGAGLRGCDFTASVSWESDDQARISALDARFLRTPGCVEGF